MTDIWDERPIAFYTAPAGREGVYHTEKMDVWLERLKEEFREIKAQSRVHRQHRMLYQGQRDELRKKLEIIEYHLKNHECMCRFDFNMLMDEAELSEFKENHVK